MWCNQVNSLETMAVLARLQARRAELAARQEQAARDAAHTDSPLPQDFADQAGLIQNDPVLDEIEAAARVEIAEIDQALGRLASGRYGICRQCQAPIDPGRLTAVPYAILCFTCASA